MARYYLLAPSIETTRNILKHHEQNPTHPTTHLHSRGAGHLFDRGFISLEDISDVLFSRVADVTSLKWMGLDPDSPPRPLAFNGDQRHFLDFHRREVFLGAD